MIQSRMFKLFLLVLIGVGWGFLLSAKTYAADLNGVSMGPSIVDKTVKPGEGFEQVFDVQNRTAEMVKIEPYVQDYRVENNLWSKVENPDATWSPMTWATIVNTPDKLNPAEQGKILVRFNVPKNAELGEHVTYFSVRFVPQVAKSEGDQATQVTVASEVRSIVYVKVTDTQGNLNLKQDWRLEKTGTGFWHFKSPVFIISAVNTGNVHLEVRGNIEITDLIRNQKTELNVPLFNILPATNKDIGIAWKEAPFIGYFQAKMQLTYDDKNFVKRNFSFVIVPLLTLAGTLIIIIAFILSVVLYIRKLQKRLAEMERLQDNQPKS